MIKIYGHSDDCLEMEGDIRAEEYEDDGVVAFDDGTMLGVKYGKPGSLAIWAISVINKGPLFDRVEVCDDENADVYSDIAYMKDGIKHAVIGKRVHA